MKLPSFLMTVATLAVFPMPAALAADMPEWTAPPVYPAPTPGTSCSMHGGWRQVDDVWRPGQLAYILAGRCGNGGPLLVYYNGGSMNRTDIRILRK